MFWFGVVKKSNNGEEYVLGGFVDVGGWGKSKDKRSGVGVSVATVWLLVAKDVGSFEGLGLDRVLPQGPPWSFSSGGGSVLSSQDLTPYIPSPPSVGRRSNLLEDETYCTVNFLPEA